MCTELERLPQDVLTIPVLSLQLTHENLKRKSHLASICMFVIFTVLINKHQVHTVSIEYKCILLSMPQQNLILKDNSNGGKTVSKSQMGKVHWLTLVTRSQKISSK